MAYSELIKNFNRVRDYMREFYVYGFKSRDEYRKKSGRSYDDEKRRIESFFGDHMQFRQTADGKNVFLSIDSRTSKHNPLYKAWKAKSFTDGDITLHFILMDILMTSDKPLTIHEITEQIDRNTSRFHAEVYDASELVPWIRTFLCRITEIHFSDRKLEDQFKRDIEEMYRLYGIEQDIGMEGGEAL